MSSADLLLHPVRLRIVKAFLGDRSLTATQLTTELADVPSATLYRHISRLVKVGVLHVVTERRVRGTIERTYKLQLLAARLQPDEVESMALDEHAQAFMAYVAGLLGDFDRYLSNQPQPGRDGADYRVGAMWLTDDEYTEFLGDFTNLLTSRAGNLPTAGRHRRVIYQVMLPAPEHRAAE